ncbi:hypothetical protein CHLRE_02g074700v5 [Chlamydomonas reinhardtii]|uniref:Uncharacterized protein n=1 Tax=Chlamydomonas reinhardtii TaxID=3055 RepID=A8I9X7_CHLRE|nr:uncharacterized protein CHLRE_02g074700v5 [Chlamydomonas reinhardtii]PNW86137.1 hypothetical protein CHLRE_02g074700v5 [Chlamydomonas reinhardtii]|eukprot:XP_001701626.1 predicted protein [Chlamydomonas reinhardtii]
MACSLASRGLSARPCPRALRSSQRAAPLRCRALLGHGSPESSEEPKPESTADAITRSLTELSGSSGRVSLGSNLLLCAKGEEEWRRLSNKVYGDKFPIQRSFTAVGTGGQDFRQAMVAAVESVVGYVHTECVAEKHSSAKKYISVTVGPVWVENGEQIIAIYQKMKDDARARYLI